MTTTLASVYMRIRIFFPRGFIFGDMMYVMQRVRSRTVANKHAGKTGHGTGLSTGPPPTRRKSNGEKTGLRTGPHANRRRKTGHGTGLSTGPPPTRRKSNGEKTGLRTGPHANRRRKTGHGTGLPTGPPPTRRKNWPAFKVPFFVHFLLSDIFLS